jgi:hypothetical protein
MPRKIITHPFQLELLQRQKDKARIERELKLCQRIYTSAELSEKERKRRFAFIITEKQFAAQRSESSDDSELDSDSSLDVETINEVNLPNLKESFPKPFDSRELTFGLIIGILIGLPWSRISEPIHLPPHLSKSHSIDNSRMVDAKMNSGDDLIDYNEVDPEDLITEKNPNAPDQGNGDPLEELDWTFDDA